MKYTWEAKDITEGRVATDKSKRKFMAVRDPQRDETDMLLVMDGMIVERNKTRHQIAKILNEMECVP